MGVETVDGVECVVVEGVPRTNAIAKELGYGKVVWRVDTSIWMSRSSDYWDVNGNVDYGAEVGDKLFEQRSLIRGL
jgi:hypothetical protein